MSCHCRLNHVGKKINPRVVRVIELIEAISEINRGAANPFWTHTGVLVSNADERYSAKATLSFYIARTEYTSETFNMDPDTFRVIIFPKQVDQEPILSVAYPGWVSTTTFNIPCSGVQRKKAKNSSLLRKACSFAS